MQLQAEGVRVRAGSNYQYWPESGWIPHAVLKSTLHLSNLGDCSPPQLMTAEQVKAMSVADHQNDWRMLVFRLAILIPETHGRLDTAAGRRLKVSTHPSDSWGAHASDSWGTHPSDSWGTHASDSALPAALWKSKFWNPESDFFCSTVVCNRLRTVLSTTVKPLPLHTRMTTSH